MVCPICGAELYEKERRETTVGTFIAVRCTKPGCNYFDYKTLPLNISGTITEMHSQIK